MFGVFKKPLAVLVAALVAGTVAGGPASAERARWRDRPAHGDFRGGARDERLIPLEQIVARLRARYSGDMIGSAQLIQTSSGPVYLIKWLTDDGRRLDIEVDARTGRILSVSG